MKRIDSCSNPASIKRSRRHKDCRLDLLPFCSITSRLSFGIDTHGPRWSDSGSKTLEDTLLEISDGPINIALRQKVRNLDSEEENRREAEEHERLKAKEQKRKDEEARFKKLIADAKDWQTSQLLRSYIEAVQSLSVTTHGRH